ncbi:hypothetical protein FGIG_11121, partial [Fasciola gigantica]
TNSSLQQLSPFRFLFCQISFIPDELHELLELYSLDVSKNQLTELPASLCQLKHLMDLNCSRNLINTLPSRLYRLKQIEQAHIMDGLNRRGLWIVGNPLQSIPKAIWQSTSTKRLWNFLRHEKRKHIPERTESNQMHVLAFVHVPDDRKLTRTIVQIRSS